MIASLLSLTSCLWACNDLSGSRSLHPWRQESDYLTSEAVSSASCIVFRHSCIKHTGPFHLWKTCHSLNSLHPGPPVTVTPVCSGLVLPNHVFVPDSDLKLLHNSLSPNSFSQYQELLAAQERPKTFSHVPIQSYWLICFSFTCRLLKSHWNIQRDFSQIILRQAQARCTLYSSRGHLRGP